MLQSKPLRLSQADADCLGVSATEQVLKTGRIGVAEETAGN